MGNCLLRAVQRQKGVGQVMMCLGVIRLERKGGLIVADRHFRAVQRGQDRADANLGVGRLRSPTRGLTQHQNRLLEIALLSVNRAEPAPCAEMIRLDAKNRAVEMPGRLQVATLMQAARGRKGRSDVDRAGRGARGGCDGGCFKHRHRTSRLGGPSEGRDTHRATTRSRRQERFSTQDCPEFGGSWPINRNTEMPNASARRAHAGKVLWPDGGTWGRSGDAGRPRWGKRWRHGTKGAGAPEPRSMPSADSRGFG
jgi:hypothetical protein